MKGHKKFYPVIHCISSTLGGEEHVLRNVDTALLYGADGVFLIGHGMNRSMLCYLYNQVRTRFPDAWIGLNFLDISSADEIGLYHTVDECSYLDALWTDSLPNTRLNLQTKAKVFGGVAFKYIDPHVSGAALEKACLHARKVVDIVTTSGNKTGVAPGIGKLREIRAYLGAKIPLAVASGVSVENVLEFLDVADIFLVASSISKLDTSYGVEENLVPKKVEELARLIHQL